jgi:hypothetical protein
MITNLGFLGGIRYHRRKFPRLALLARQLLAIPAANVEAERTFSCSNNAITEDRPRLNESTASAYVSLKIGVWNKKFEKYLCLGFYRIVYRTVLQR